MTKQIWKYPLNGIISNVEIPMDAEILTVQLQNGQPTIWALVNPKNELESRNFTIVGTGNPFDDTNHQYIGTFQIEPFVWHLFEIVK
jgi:hypothetical protein